MSNYKETIAAIILASHIHETKKGCPQLPGIVAKGLEEMEQTQFQLRNLKRDLRNLQLEITEKKRLIALVQEKCRHYTRTFEQDERCNVCESCGKLL